jgi:hypothetical protein
MKFVTFKSAEKVSLGILTNAGNAIIPLPEAEKFYLNSATLPDTMF